LDFLLRNGQSCNEVAQLIQFLLRDLAILNGLNIGSGENLLLRAQSCCRVDPERLLRGGDSRRFLIGDESIIQNPVEDGLIYVGLYPLNRLLTSFRRRQSLLLLLQVGQHSSRCRRMSRNENGIQRLFVVGNGFSAAKPDEPSGSGNGNRYRDTSDENSRVIQEPAEQPDAEPDCDKNKQQPCVTLAVCGRLGTRVTRGEMLAVV
jgi:hypothetical protein